MIRKWDTIENKFISNLKIFDLHEIRRRHPDWGRESVFVALESPRWVNIIPVTKDNKVILIEQYRHGIDEITLEVPGGLVEESESTLHAAQRECIEETGYAAPHEAELLGENYPNPAFLTNKCYSYLWLGCEKKFAQQLDGNEDINVIELPMPRVKEYIEDGKIRHSLVLTAFFFYSLKYGL